MIKFQVWEIKSTVRYESSVVSSKVKITINKIPTARNKVSDTGFQTNAIHIKLQAQQILGFKECFKPSLILKEASTLGLCSTRQLTLNLACFLKTGG